MIVADRITPILAGGHGTRCVLIGEETLVVQCGETLIRHGWDIAALVTRRGAVRHWAETRAIDVFDDAAALRDGLASPIDYLFSITNLQILSPDILSLPGKAAINFHDGPLPAYAGLNTPVWAILNGEPLHGVTWHLMTAGIDRGEILSARTFEIDAAETTLTLNAKCFAAAMETFEELIAGLAEKTCRPYAQPPGRRRYYGRRHRPPAAGLIDWNSPAAAIDRLVRALHFGAHFNPLGTAKTVLEGRLAVISEVALTSRPSIAPPGTIVGVEANRMLVATATTDLAVLGIEMLDASEKTPFDTNLALGRQFDPIDPAAASWIGVTDAAVALHEEFWRDRLATAVPVDLPQVDRTRPAAPGYAHLDQQLPPVARGEQADAAMAAAFAYFARLTDRDDITIGYSNPIIAAQTETSPSCFLSQLPLKLPFRFDMTFAELCGAFGSEVRELYRRIGFCADLTARAPELRGTSHTMPVAILLVDDVETLVPAPGGDLILAMAKDGCRWFYDPGRIARSAVGAMQRQYALLLDAALSDPAASIATLPLVDDAERNLILHDWNRTAATWRTDACIHDLISEQAERTPDAVAIVCRGESLSYGELDARANRFARRLIVSGVGPDVLVGLAIDRSVDLSVALLAIHKAGGAYVPLDPNYPADRIAFMIADAKMPVVVTTGSVRDRLAPDAATVIAIDEEWPSIARESAERVPCRAAPHHLAYVIYTSGSTGQPKGVMVEHRNVINFFAGMDERIAGPGTWLAVTSLSFDISVLELCWTLARGFTVIIQSGDLGEAMAPPVAPPRPLDFSLFYFASDAGEAGDDPYRLLIEGAKFADRNGFSAIWTPERHFHAFGGLYPNPAVTGAAVAAVTKRVGIRAGSVVLPLHHPARVAEEWSVVDRLSHGRVAISFAAGWQPDDFVLRPENYSGAKAAMLRDIDTVRRLWRGEAVDMAGPLGNVAVRTLPRPVQPELPFWLTAAGNVETFEAAGRMGANILTHLLGQTVGELTEKLAAYRRAWKAAGHAGSGQATLMLHSFVGPDNDRVRDIVREPLTAYLRSSASLIQAYAWSFPAFKRRAGMEQASDVDLSALDDDELTALLDYAFERYYKDAGLFGTPSECSDMIDRVRGAGVDEIACLIDFGIATQTVLDHLPWLDRVRAAASVPAAEASEDSLAALMQRHAVTHLQCTPSMARMMVDGGIAASAFGNLQHLLIGGEAFPPRLAEDLLAVTGARITNMYGPTETTIWSTTDVVGTADSIALGRPLANQEVFILDRRGEPVPVGIPGEIVIGGRGVTRGYLDRPDLTAARFTPHPFRHDETVYHTGDLGRFRDDGTIEFLGRMDHQVKIRGHRIELGEIEAVLTSQPTLREAVVMVREDVPGDQRLCAYVVAAEGAVATPTALRDALRTRLPEFMIPAHIVMLAELPRTPNAKVDRKALPLPDTVPTALSTEAFVEPAGGLEARLAEIWRDILKLDSVGAADNFFDLGGHSLLAVQLHRRLRDVVPARLSITDIFRFPTIATLAAHLSGQSGAAEAVAAAGVENRAMGRLAAIARRRGVGVHAA